LIFPSVASFIQRFGLQHFAANCFGNLIAGDCDANIRSLSLAIHNSGQRTEQRDTDEKAWENVPLFS
jgi:hypothetical protein